jgi:hypothetical protein
MLAQGMTHGAIYDAFLANGVVIDAAEFRDTRPALFRLAEGQSE